MGDDTFTLRRIVHVVFFFFVGAVLLAFVNQCAEPLMEDELSGYQRLVLLYTVCALPGVWICIYGVLQIGIWC